MAFTNPKSFQAENIQHNVNIPIRFPVRNEEEDIKCLAFTKTNCTLRKQDKQIKRQTLFKIN